MKDKEIKDAEIKKLFAGLAIEAPSSNFEDRIIASVLNKRNVAKPSYFPRIAAMAAMVLIIFSFSVMHFEKDAKDTSKGAAEYAQLVDGSVVSEDDVYSDLIVASN